MIGEQTSSIATVLRNKQNAQDFWEKVLNGGDFELIETLLAPGYTFNGKPSAPSGTVGWLKSIRTAAPDAYFRLESLVGANDTVAVRWTLTATTGGVKTMLTGENILTFNDQGQCTTNWQSMGTPDFAHPVSD